LLPMLGAGHTHKEGAYAKTMDRGLSYLLGKQKEDGRFDGSAYQYGLAAMVLCEAYGLTMDSALKDPAQRAIDAIAKGQHPGGGWRYEPGQAGDMSTTTWPFIALMTGRAAGLRVPDITVERVARFLDTVSSPDGGSLGYVPKETAQKQDQLPPKD